MSGFRSVGGGVLVALSSWWCALHGAQAPQLPSWEASSERLKSLAEPAKFADWSVRPPLNARHRVHEEGEETRYVWAVGRQGMMFVTFSPVDAESRSPEGALADYLERIGRHTKGLDVGPSEKGTVGGREFIRVRYRAESLAGLNMPGFGFVYVAVDGDRSTMLGGMATDADIEVAEAAALTFRSTAAPAVAAPNRPFIFHRRQVPPKREANHHVRLTKPVDVTIKVTSQGPFSVIAISDRAHKALMDPSDPYKPTRQDQYLNAQSEGPTFERAIRLPAGTTWFIIENRAGEPVEVLLEGRLRGN